MNTNEQQELTPLQLLNKKIGELADEIVEIEKKIRSLKEKHRELNIMRRAFEEAVSLLR